MASKNINDLPDEVLEIIIAHLSVIEIIKLERVNKRFRRVIKMEILPQQKALTTYMVVMIKIGHLNIVVTKIIG